MPELPEVEIVRLGLAARLAGRRIERLDLHKIGGFGGLARRQIEARLTGRHFASIRRDGKRLVFALDGPDDLAFHFKLWGQLRWRDEPIAPDRLTAVVWRLDDGTALEFRELELSTFDFQRRDSTSAADLLSERPSAQEARLFGRGAVRALLSDQERFPGLGNLYALEILFRAGVHPVRKGADLSTRERRAIAAAIPKTLREAIRRGGYPPFADLDGRVGRYRLRVYDRGGQACTVCRTAIAAGRVAGRPGFWCPRCQPERPSST